MEDEEEEEKKKEKEKKRRQGIVKKRRNEVFRSLLYLFLLSRVLDQSDKKRIGREKKEKNIYTYI